MLYERPRYLDQGEAALTVEFGDAVDPVISASVLALDEALRACPPPGVRETTPTYRSLLVFYEPLEISRGELIARIESLAGAVSRSDANAQSAALPHDGRATRWIVPCCYDPALAEDVAEAAGRLNLPVESLVALHAGGVYRAYMYGFAPGWCYLGGLPAGLAIPRRLAPRGPTPQGAVLIGGGLSLIATNPMPTGWYVIGRTPELLFSLNREPPFLVAPGDELRFEPVDAETHSTLAARAAQGETVARREDSA